MLSTHPAIRSLPLLGALGLALGPLQWLVASWLDPLYGDLGLPVALLCAGLFAWSASSTGSRGRADLALGLLAATALLRLGGTLLAVNTIGALALVVDIYALGLWAGLQHRQRALSPGWLAILFGFSLPLERLLQRLLGFPLQQLSASGACTLLEQTLGSLPVDCQGVRILLAGRDVLVDLPCSGSRTLLLLLVAFITLATLHRPGPGRALAGLLLTLLTAWLVNSTRIALLAVGIAFPSLPGVDLMAQPWHELVGGLTLAIGALPLLLWLGWLPPKPTTPSISATHQHPSRSAASLGVGLLAVALLIPWLPARPLDVAHASSAPTLPAVLGELIAHKTPLSAAEHAYFSRYGGGAARAWYGELGLTLVRTSAPLRHLHAPDECLGGLGHQVSYQGRDHGALPTAVYRSTDPAGQQWRVAVSFISEHGQSAASVAEAVWLWWQQPGSWMQIQRITPWDTDPARQALLETTLRRALELPAHAPATMLADNSPL